MFTCKHVDHVRVNHLCLPCYKQNYHNVSIWLNQNSLYYTTARTLILTFVNIIGTIFNDWNRCVLLIYVRLLVFDSDAESCSRGPGSFAGLLCCVCVCENTHVERLQL